MHACLSHNGGNIVSDRSYYNVQVFGNFNAGIAFTYISQNPKFRLGKISGGILTG
jgi:hypothetical protein